MVTLAVMFAVPSTLSLASGDVFSESESGPIPTFWFLSMVNA